MKGFKYFCVVLLSIFALASCGPKELVFWSPDGKRVAVIAGDGLHLGNAEGQLSGPILKEVSGFRWLPDSSRAVIVKTRKTSSWHDVKGLLTKAEQTKAIAVAESMRRFQGDPTKWLAKDDVPFAQEAVLYLRTKYGARAERETLKKFRVNETITVDLSTIQVYQLPASGEAVPVGATLFKSIRGIDDLRISPNGKLVAIAENGDLADKLSVVALDSGKVKVISSSAGGHADWAADSKKLSYIWTVNIDKACKGKDDNARALQLATLGYAEVADAAGNLRVESVKPVGQAELVYSDTDEIRTLPDGTTLYSAGDIQLPCSYEKFHYKKALFKISSDGQTLTQLWPAGEPMGDALAFFEVNQDGTKIALAGGHGQVTLIDVKSGERSVIERRGPEELKFVPQWRTANQLCYAARPETKAANQHDVEVVLRTLTGAEQTVLSKDWNAEKITFLKDGTKRQTAGKTAK